MEHRGSQSGPQAGEEDGPASLNKHAGPAAREGGKPEKEEQEERCRGVAARVERLVDPGEGRREEGGGDADGLPAKVTAGTDGHQHSRGWAEGAFFAHAVSNLADTARVFCH